MTFLVADVGGTNTRFALYDQNGLYDVQHWPTARHSNLLESTEYYLGRVSSSPTAGCVAVAAPIDGGRAKLTNCRWSADVCDMPFSTLLINDLQAAGYGLSKLTAKDLQIVQSGSLKEGVTVVIGLGTGHGQAIVVGDQVYSTEAGHAEFAPFDEDSMRLWQFLFRRNGRVRIEDILSGNGMENLLDFSKLSYPLETLPEGLGAAVSISLFESQSERCAMAQRLFLSALGSLCADVILQTNATRLVLVGGVSEKMSAKIDCSEFWKGFRNKSPMQKIVDSARVEVLINQEIGLLGAATVAERVL